MNLKNSWKIALPLAALLLVPGYAAVTVSLKEHGMAPGDATSAQMRVVADAVEALGAAEAEAASDVSLRSSGVGVVGAGKRPSRLPPSFLLASHRQQKQQDQQAKERSRRRGFGEPRVVEMDKVTTAT